MPRSTFPRCLRFSRSGDSVDIHIHIQSVWQRVRGTSRAIKTAILAHGYMGSAKKDMGGYAKNYIKWIHYVLNRVGPDAQIVLHGVSMGGATVRMTSGEKLPEQVKCVVADCAYDDARSALRSQRQRVGDFLQKFIA
jgi:hypothetical protein